VDQPGLHRTSLTVPAASASIGISIFIDSSRTSSSPASWGPILAEPRGRRPLQRGVLQRRDELSGHGRVPGGTHPAGPLRVGGKAEHGPHHRVDVA